MAKKPIGPVRRDFAPWDDPQARPYIEFRNVTKTFGDFIAVDDLSLKIYEREFFALLGGSGCGKTTMMRMLAGFETPNAGEIFLDGQNLAGVPPYKRPVNMMFQSYALFPHMSVEANVAFGLKQEGMPKAEIGERVEEMLKLVKLQDFARRKPHQLSGGQRQRVALARSLAKKPKVLLLDEPLGALDRKLREETQFELTDLQYELGMTFLIVTHDQEEAHDDGRPDRGDGQGPHRPDRDTGGDLRVAELPLRRRFRGRRSTCSRATVTAARQRRWLRIAGASGFELSVHQDGAGGRCRRAATWCGSPSVPEKVRHILRNRTGKPRSMLWKGEVWDIAYLGDISTYHTHIVKLDETVRATVVNR